MYDVKRCSIAISDTDFVLACLPYCSVLPALVPVIGCVPVLLVLLHANGSCQHEGQLAHCDQFPCGCLKSTVFPFMCTVQ